MARPPRDKIIRAARDLQDKFPEVAAWLRKVVRPVTERRRRRMAVLRAIRAQHFADDYRTVAARLIAAAWANLDTRVEPSPGSLEDSLHRLARLGLRPVAWRMIAEDIDETFN